MRSRGTEMVPGAPFAAWLESRVDHWRRHLAFQTGCIQEGDRGPVQRLLAEIGWPAGDTGQRRMHRYRYGRTDSKRGGKRVNIPMTEYPREVVEDALHHAGVPFSDLYPNIAAAEELTLEPEAWCPGCQDLTSPINGQCPWCDWRVSKPTGQTLQGRRLAA